MCRTSHVRIRCNVSPNVISGANEGCGCRVGTGLNVEERKDVDRRLQPLFIENKATSKKHNAPKCYRVTNSSEERPDVWISDPYKSIVFKAGLSPLLTQQHGNPMRMEYSKSALAGDLERYMLCSRSKVEAVAEKEVSTEVRGIAPESLRLDLAVHIVPCPLVGASVGTHDHC